MWPDGVQCATCLTFDLDAETAWTSIDPATVDEPGLMSMGRYGPLLAVPLILSVLEKHSIESTFFIPGKVAEDYPDTVQSIVDAGHEIAAHGYSHLLPSSLSKEEEEEALTRSKAILEGTGAKVVGYRAPGFLSSKNTIELLQKHNIAYSSSMMDDLKPYRHPGTDVIELPVHLLLEDWIHLGFGDTLWSKNIAPTRWAREIWEEEFEGIYKLGGVAILILHPQVMGRPSRLKMLDEFIDFAKSHDRLWIATCVQVAEHARTVVR